LVQVAAVLAVLYTAEMVATVAAVAQGCMALVLVGTE